MCCEPPARASANRCVDGQGDAYASSNGCSGFSVNCGAGDGAKNRGLFLEWQRAAGVSSRYAERVVLVRERSDGVCEQGSTWGYDSRGIFVSGGCSAEFQVGGSGNNDGNSNGYGNNNGNNSDNQNRNQSGYGNNGNSNGDGNSGRGNGSGNGYGTNNRQRGNGNDQNDNGNSNYGNGQGRGGTIPAGTRMDVKLEQTASPNSAKQGDVVPGRLVNDVVVNGTTVAAAGSQVQMKVTSVQSGNPGSLSLQLDSMSANGRDYRLSSNSIHNVRDSQTAQNGTTIMAVETFWGQCWERLRMRGRRASCRRDRCTRSG